MNEEEELERGERDQSASALIYYDDGIYTLLSLTSRKQLDYHLLSLTPKNTWHGHDFPGDLEGFLICKNNGWRRRVVLVLALLLLLCQKGKLE